VMDLRLLQLFWPLPPQRAHYTSSPTRYVSHLLGHEGEGSILSYLKAKGWANELSAGAQFDNVEWASMDVSIDLTDEGVKHGQEVMKVIYAYLHLITKAGPQEYVFEEMQQTAANSFRFLSKQQPMSYTSALAHRMQKYPSEHFISGTREGGREGGKEGGMLQAHSSLASLPPSLPSSPRPAPRPRVQPYSHPRNARRAHSREHAGDDGSESLHRQHQRDRALVWHCLQ